MLRYLRLFVCNSVNTIHVLVNNLSAVIISNNTCNYNIVIRVFLFIYQNYFT